jgi:hypothetical protein
MIKFMDEVKYIGTYHDIKPDVVGIVLSITDGYYNVGFAPGWVWPCYESELVGVS